MRVAAYKIDGHYYICELSKQKIEISFYLVSKQIEPMIKKSGFSRKSGLFISKETYKKKHKCRYSGMQTYYSKKFPFFY